MFELNLTDEQINNLNETERFKIIQSVKIDKKIFKYIKTKLASLDIDIGDNCAKNIIELMNEEKLDGKCWQTTEASIIFFNDDDYIIRGSLIFDKYTLYDHSWICIKYNNKEYIFDPCLNIVCDRILFDKIFKPKIVATVNADKVRTYLINALQNKTTKDLTIDQIRLQRLFNEAIYNDPNKDVNEIIIKGNDDPKSEMFRNNTGYIADIEDGKIRKLYARIYHSQI